MVGIAIVRKESVIDERRIRIHAGVCVLPPCTPLPYNCPQTLQRGFIARIGGRITTDALVCARGISLPGVVVRIGKRGKRTGDNRGKENYLSCRDAEAIPMNPADSIRASAYMIRSAWRLRFLQKHY